MFNTVGNSLYAEKKRFSVINLIVNVILVLLVLVLAFEIFFTSRYAGIYVVHSSMKPTLTGAMREDVAGGDYVYIEKGAKPKYGDVVVAYWKLNDYDIIKRCIATGGDTVRIINGRLEIKYRGTDNFVEVEESYLVYNDPEKSINTFPQKNTEAGHLVEDGYVFLLGDNRDDSNDSRQYGDFKESDILGVVPKWSIKYKNLSTAWHTFFAFTLG